MERLMQTVTDVARQVAAEFVDRGGRLTGAGEELTPDDFASPKGALGPVFWMAGEFCRDYEIPFPFATFEPTDSALSGYRLCEIPLREHSAALTLYTFADFLRKELMAEQTNELDLSNLFQSFRDWCEVNVGGVAGNLSPDRTYG